MISDISIDLQKLKPTDIPIVEGLVWSARRYQPRRVQKFQVIYADAGGRYWHLFEIQQRDAITIGEG